MNSNGSIRNRRQMRVFTSELPKWHYDQSLQPVRIIGQLILYDARFFLVYTSSKIRQRGQHIGV